MKLTIPEISWHNRDPVLSVDLQQKSSDIYRLVTSGTDSHILIWHVTIDSKGDAKVEFASDLQRHQKAVNCVRFSPNGEYLASCDDESNIIIWKQKSDQDAPELPPPNSNENETYKEQWISFKTLRGHIDDIYDLSWSIDSLYLISGSIDNSAIIWDIQKGKNVGIFSDHKGFVQGVNWDPLNQYVATLCSDRKLRVYTLSSSRSRPIVNLSKSTLPFPAEHELANKTLSLYYDDTFKAYFRRLSFSPDGNLLATPAGIIETSNKNINATYIFARNQMNKPVVVLPSAAQMAIAVRFCPILFKLRGSYSQKNSNSEEKENESEQQQQQQQQRPAPSSLFNLPYRMVLAVATNASVTFYDTEQSEPFGMISNMHYTRLTDLTWSSDGSILVVSSTDGYCSIVTFGENELGKVYKTRDTLYQELLKKTTETPCVLLSNSIQKTPKIFINKSKQHSKQKQKQKKRVSLITLGATKGADDKAGGGGDDDDEEETEKRERKEKNEEDEKEIGGGGNKMKNEKNAMCVKEEEDKQQDAMEIDDDEVEEDEEEEDDEVLAEELEADDEGDEESDAKNIKTKKEEEEERKQKARAEAMHEEIQKNLKIIQQKIAQKPPRRVQLITLNSPKGK